MWIVVVEFSFFECWNCRRFCTENSPLSLFPSPGACSSVKKGEKLGIFVAPSHLVAAFLLFRPHVYLIYCLNMTTPDGTNSGSCKTVIKCVLWVLPEHCRSLHFCLSRHTKYFPHAKLKLKASVEWDHIHQRVGVEL